MFPGKTKEITCVKSGIYTIYVLYIYEVSNVISGILLEIKGIHRIPVFDSTLGLRAMNYLSNALEALGI